MLPQAARAPLVRHLASVKALHQQDLRTRGGAVALPDALDRKAPSLATEPGQAGGAEPGGPGGPGGGAG